MSLDHFLTSTGSASGLLRGGPRPAGEVAPVGPHSQRVGAHNSVVGADQGFRAPSWDQESVRDSGHEHSASAPIAAGQRPRPSFRHPQGFGHPQGALRRVMVTAEDVTVPERSTEAKPVTRLRFL